ncbi:hypothetical protein HIM_03097 [Hirsutella minnesotensis 3608]|nr:hypothetical protein HIM_03097 [Hirsutella minnesotensis 3608]
MDVDTDNEVLARLASGDPIKKASWPGLRAEMMATLDKIAHEAFPIPKLPPPAEHPRLLSPLASSTIEPSSQETVKETAPADDKEKEADAEGNAADVASVKEDAAKPPSDAVVLPQQIADQLAAIKTKLETFTDDAPHTIQRLAELVLKPRAHYKALAPYLHAVDRVVQVTSGTSVYPLPPAISDMTGLNGGASGLGDEAKDPAATVTWSNPTTAALGSDEALGGALLTPIPWLTRRSPESTGESGSTPAGSGAGAQIHSEGTETIDGPNGVGSIETVSVSVNGVPSTGHARGVTQGELLRQEQRAGVVPVSQLTRSQGSPGDEDRNMHDDDDDVTAAKHAAGEDDAETPHVRGPEEIGVNDTGPQGVTTSYVGEDGILMQGIDVAAAVGRKHDEDVIHHQQAPQPQGDEAMEDGQTVAPDAMDGAADAAVGANGANGAKAEDGEDETRSSPAAGTKREAEQALEAETPKKAKEGDEQNTDMPDAGADAEAEAQPHAAAQADTESAPSTAAAEPGAEDAADGAAADEP